MAGGGVGEAMLISAVTGAGTAAVTGGDPLKGALLGAATGGIGHGIAGAGAAGGAGATGAAAATSTGLEAGLQAVPDAATLADASNLAATAPNIGISAPASTSGAYTDAFTLPMDSGIAFKVTDPEYGLKTLRQMLVLVKQVQLPTQCSPKLLRWLNRIISIQGLVWQRVQLVQVPRQICQRKKIFWSSQSISLRS
jgi:hypothetical protein